MSTPFTIVGIGESLFDFVGDQQHPGGAPMNVAIHAQQLGKAAGGRGVLVSRVGQDELGTQIAQTLRERGMTLDYLQTDPDHPTGRVYVEPDADGGVSYEIVQNAAWDLIQYDPDMDPLAMSCQAVCFGSLAQRHAQSRNSIYRFIETSRARYKMFDVNLRKPFYDRQHINRSCELATVVKLNIDELDDLTGMLSLDGQSVDDRVKALMGKFDLRMVVLTRGKDGTVLYTPAGRYEGEPASYNPTEGADPVGAGDSVSAAVLVGKALRMPDQQVATLANRVGAYVAAHAGATPDLPDDLLKLFHS
ncbi:MAG: carbohydrate kinase [Phycisphaerales bacterium]